MPITLSILSKFDPRGIRQAQTGFDKLGAGIHQFAQAATVAFAAAAAGAIYFGAQSIRAASESEAISRSLLRMAQNSEAFAATTGDVGKAVNEIMDFNKKLSNLYGIDDEILNSIVRGWMAVPDLAGKGVKGIEKMVQVVADVAAGTGKDIESVGMAFIKVAGDEETALSKLLRMGIVFTEQQKQQYKDILNTNGEIAAQDYLIGELGKTYAGSAEAVANPFAILQQNIQNLQEDIGVLLLPYLEKFVNEIIPKLNENAPALGDVFGKIGEVLGFFVDALINMATWYSENPSLFEGIAGGIGLITAGLVGMDIALSANPFGAIIMAIGILAGIITWFVVDWETWSFKLRYVWNEAWWAIASGTATFANMVIGSLNNLLIPINLIIDGLNGLFGLNLSRLEIPKISNMQLAIADLQRQGITYGWQQAGVLGDVVGGGGGVRTLRPMATGGIVMSPIPALVGEAGPEAVIPLDQLGKMGYGGGSTYNITVNGGLGTSAEIGEMVVSAIKRYERSNGAVFQAA